MDPITTPRDPNALTEIAQQGGSGCAFQSTLAAAVQSLQRASAEERGAQDAAISLAQRDRLAALAAELDDARVTLADALDAQGRALIPVPTPRERLLRLVKRPDRTPSAWRTRLHGAAHVVAESAASMERIVTGQSPHTPARQLGEAVASLLAEHRDRLQAETARLAA